MKSILRGIISLLFVILPATQIFADETGEYVTAGRSQYKDGKFSLSPWGDGYNMDTILVRDGREYEVKAFLRPAGDHLYEGSGFVYVRFDQSHGCRHRFATKIYVTDAGLYLRDNMPRQIPYDPYGACQAAGLYVWTNHEAPYNR
jgi:hypothetical protein